MDQYTFIVRPDEECRRIDLYLQGKIGAISRSRVQRLITDGCVTVNGSEVRGSYRPKGGDEIEVVVPDPVEFRLVAENIPLSIVYEDEEIVVIDKPPGMVVHPAPGHWTGTLVNALLHHVKDFRGISGQLRPGLVHRLDKDTSGLLVVAKSDRSLQFLSDEMKERRIKRRYIAFVWGHLRDEEGRIDAPVGRSRKDRKKMAVTNVGAREAATSYRVISRCLFADVLELQLGTGRTHQIRVHLSHLGHPVVGDPEYGGRDKALRGVFDQHRQVASEILAAISRQALHAYRLSFKHPSSNLEMSFRSELPEDMQRVEEILRREGEGG